MATATAVKETPILMQGDMVRATLEDRKTNTRRIIDDKWFDECVCQAVDAVLRSGCIHSREFRHPHQHAPTAKVCPYGKPGDRLWVRETWLPFRHDHIMDGKRYAYSADSIGNGDSDRCRVELGYKWRPSIHMPRAACRLTLEITDVRVQRVQDITSDDIIAEGVQYPVTEDRHPIIRLTGKCPPVNYHRRINVPAGETLTHDELLRCHFASLWDSINGEGAWKRNDWVWAIAFKRLEQ